MMSSVSIEREGERMAVLTPPLSLEGGLLAEYHPPNLLQQAFGLFQGMHLGSDLTSFQLPPCFNLPKSQLQSYSEPVYCFGEDYLKRCNQGKNSLERFTSVVAWCFSTTRPLIFGLVPYNPILGETHHVSKGTLNVLLEQVSHHPPVSALHATDSKENVEMIWCQHAVPKFYGSSVEAVIHGKRQLRLLNFGENYQWNSPNLLIKILPVPSSNWSGNILIKCKESGLEAELCFYRSHSFLGFGGNSRSVKGRIFHSDTRKAIYKIDGQWDRTILLKDVESRKTAILYNAKQAISNLGAPRVKDTKALWATESSVVWGEVNQAILKGDWEKANEAKRGIEEKERRFRGERNSGGENWVPKHFRVSCINNTEDGVWECWPLQQLVPQAPIIVPY